MVRTTLVGSGKSSLPRRRSVLRASAGPEFFERRFQDRGQRKRLPESLDEGQRSKVLFEFNDAAQRTKWSNLPTTMVPRAGLKMGDLSGPQRKAAMGLLAATLSKRGYEKVLAIVEGDEVLKSRRAAGAGRCSGATCSTFRFWASLP
jgi:hypothetical protein